MTTSQPDQTPPNPSNAKPRHGASSPARCRHDNRTTVCEETSESPYGGDRTKTVTAYCPDCETAFAKTFQEGFYGEFPQWKELNPSHTGALRRKHPAAFASFDAHRLNLSVEPVPETGTPPSNPRHPVDSP